MVEGRERDIGEGGGQGNLVLHPSLEEVEENLGNEIIHSSRFTTFFHASRKLPADGTFISLH